ncbi:efflux RND transporter periplasmic adaptor subunit [Xylophilus rhododendri]|uniref:Efflux RND transporter periplasmic adaptor subunit n=1 Tax=Xylophilus rhododendri TaxID=2697032 RepID=A0A857JA30_9BURK|nr:efflux RND transporter periplasmic adaptor subunit [Xylophilus rhododendri]QHJ00588.1 efflux RND transporter periplasmic adaptor subunit [Xylophilus rhododendri]
MTDASNKNFSTQRRRYGVALSVATVAVAAGAAALIGLPGSASSADAGSAAPPPAPPVSVSTVAERQINAWDEYSGRLEAVQRVDVRSRVAGAVQSVHFREGALVKAGDLLVTIDPAPYAAEVDRAAAEVAAAKARLDFSRSEQARAQRLWDDKAIAERELDERRNAGAEADARLRGAQAALQSARLNLGYTQVRAPVAGRIGRIEVTVGNLVAAGPSAPVLTTLVSVSPIYASFDADEQALGRTGARAASGSIPVRMGTAGQEDMPYTGRLQLIDNQVDARSGTVRVRAVFDNADGSLTPGQFARIQMGHARSSQAILVSERAVGTDQSRRYVMVVGADNKAEYREIKLGAPVDGLRVVTSGLKSGERIVVNGLQRVRPGATVAPQEVPMQQARTEQAARPS